MRNFLIFLIASILFGCNIYTKTDYDFKFKMIEPVESNNLVYQDEFINIGFDVTTAGVHVVLMNATENPIKIVWNDAAWVQNGRSQKMAHTGMYIKNIYKEETPPTFVPGKTTIKEGIGPADGIKYSAMNDEYSWKHYFVDNKMIAQQMKLNVQDYIGSRFKILLPIEVNGKEKYYTFTFEVSNVVNK